jgi:hypothetical protein
MNEFHKAVQEQEVQAQVQSEPDIMDRILAKLDIEVLCDEWGDNEGCNYDSYEEEFVVRFRSKETNKTITVLKKDLSIQDNGLSKKQQKIIDVLISMGGIEDEIEFFAIADHVRKKQCKMVQSLYVEMNPTELNQEALELYQKVQKSIVDQIDRYPRLSVGNYRKGDPGLIPDTGYYKENLGSDVVAVTRKHLLQLIDGRNSYPLEWILDAWKHMGCLICYDKPKHDHKQRKNGPKKRYQIAISQEGKPVERFYTMRIRGLKPMQKRNVGHE